MTEDTDFWHIYATYLHSEHRVTICGSETVLEFPEGMGLVLLLFSLARIGEQAQEMNPSDKAGSFPGGPAICSLVP